MLIVYDGVCNFYNCWVRFVAKRDHNRVFSFASALRQIEARELVTLLTWRSPNGIATAGGNSKEA